MIFVTAIVMLFVVWTLVDELFFDSMKNVTLIEHISGAILFIIAALIIATILILI